MVQGLDRLNRRFRRLPERIKRATAAAMEAGADQIVRAQKSMVDQDDGTLQSTIRHSGALIMEDRIRVEFTAGGIATTRPVREGQSPTYDYAMANEFGTEKMRAQPFFYPGYRSQQKKVKARVNRAMRKAIREG